MDDVRSIFFRDADEAFAFCRKRMSYELKVGAVLPAMVADACAEFGTPTPIKRRNSGHQIAVLHIPARDGVAQVIGETASADASDLAVGDFVEWRCGSVASGVCIGLIVGRLALELRGVHWRLAESFE